MILILQNTSKLLLFSFLSLIEKIDNIFRGLVGVGGFTPVTESLRRNIPDGVMTITFGGSGMFGYVYSSSSQTGEHRASANHISSPGDTITWWSTYGMNECPDPKTVDRTAITEDLRKRHANWSDPVIQEIIRSVNVETMYPTWTTPELPIWDRDGIVLLGDAAHALPPTSGQGSAQALEDSESFPTMLAHYLKRVYRNAPMAEFTEKDAIQLAAKKHTALRYPRVKALLDEAQQHQQKKQQKGIVGEFMMYFILWLVGKSSFIHQAGSSLLTNRTGIFSPANPAKDMLEYNIADEVQKVLAEDE
jgi:2-polyprenyl-6-methoxyphenol hydroxylase-like FAD-dependent oxidoreductase